MYQVGRKNNLTILNEELSDYCNLLKDYSIEFNEIGNLFKGIRIKNLGERNLYADVEAIPFLCDIEKLAPYLSFFENLKRLHMVSFTLNRMKSTQSLKLNSALLLLSTLYTQFSAFKEDILNIYSAITDAGYTEAVSVNTLQEKAPNIDMDKILLMFKMFDSLNLGRACYSSNTESEIFIPFDNVKN